MASEAYEDEQARLRQQYGLDEGEDDEDIAWDFSIPEVNPEIYRDVEPVLFQGFLTQPATIHNVRFVFKSLNHHEFLRLGMSYDLTNPKDLKLYYDEFLAHGVLLAGGQNVLEHREEHLADLKDFFEKIEPEAKQKVIRHVSEVNRRANKAILLTEAFCIETTSRLRWAQFKGMDLTSPAITGIPGTHRLGLNWGQLLWRAINHFEDQKENAEREWENAKFVASSMAGKGMQKIYSSDKRRRQTETDEKVKRRERIIRHALLNTPLNEDESQSHIMVARTVNELATQMERDLKGEQDWHDKVISEYEDKIKQGYDDRIEHVRQLRESHIEKYGDQAVVVGPVEMGLSKGDVSQRIRERQEKRAKALAARSQYPELFNPKYEELADKWMTGKQPIIQNPPSVMSPPNPSRPRSKPFNGGKS